MSVEERGARPAVAPEKPKLPVVVEIPQEALTEAEANAIYDQGREAVVFALLKLTQERATLAQKLAAHGQPSPSTPSGMVPVYQKPSIGRGRKKKLGRPEGHEGVRRPPAPKIHQRVEHRLACCPDCGGELSPEPSRTRTRVIEDIPQVEPVVTLHTIHGSYCRNCRKVVEPVVTDALPGSTIGNQLLTLSAWLHYGLGNTLSQIVSVLNYHLNFKVSDGGLVSMWYRLQEILYGWYEEIGEQARKSGVLHADETGWRVAGSTHWLWCFTSQAVTYYMIDRSRGEPALMKFFTEAFAGTLITDFWAPYERVQAAFRQKCLPHLFRELEKVSVHNKSPAWEAFSKKLRRLLHDALRLRKRDELSAEDYASRRILLDSRLLELSESSQADDDARRLVKRLAKYGGDLFTFLDHEEVPPSNNHGEREIRPAVIIRKNSLCNRSEQGADMQAVMMSIYRTLKLRGHDPIRTIVSALRSFLLSGKLPPLPPSSASVG
jgi:transposase